MNDIKTVDARLIHFFQRISMPIARISLFVVFFWFGILKVLGFSPAGALVHNLYDQTIAFMPFDAFYFCFALLECIIGILFLIRGLERVVLPLLLLHMIATFGPLFLLPQEAWQAPFVPTLTGQYIIKNIVLIAVAISIAAHLHPLASRPLKS